jgi:hypothetical protein
MEILRFWSPKSDPEIRAKLQWKIVGGGGVKPGVRRGQTARTFRRSRLRRNPFKSPSAESQSCIHGLFLLSLHLLSLFRLQFSCFAYSCFAYFLFRLFLFRLPFSSISCFAYFLFCLFTVLPISSFAYFLILCSTPVRSWLSQWGKWVWEWDIQVFTGVGNIVSSPVWKWQRHLCNDVFN